jgi:hypothetical protein
LEARAADLLDVPYFHVVFTVPPRIAEIALQNKSTLYGILFRSAAETLSEVAANPQHLGAQIGFLSVLHTWGQNLLHHPHVHCVVPGGGLSSDRLRWVSCPANFFLPVRVLSRVFRGKFLAHTRAAYAGHELSFHGSLAHLNDPRAFAAYLRMSYDTDWVVYAKPPFGGPTQVLKYLARYTHRVAISNHRLLAIEDGCVRFLWKDYAHGNKTKAMTLDASEFIRRFLLHVLPKGFVRIRYYGFLANASRAAMLTLCRALTDTPSPTKNSEADDPADPPSGDEGTNLRCPACKKGRLTITILVPVQPSTRQPRLSRIDSS